MAVRGAIRSKRNSGIVNQKKRKPGRPKLPKGEAKNRTLPAVRFTASEMRAVEGAARANDQSVSEWIRNMVRKSLLDSLAIANQTQGTRSNDPRRIREGLRDGGHRGGLSNRHS